MYMYILKVFVHVFIDSVRHLSVDNSAEQIAMVILDRDSCPVERFVFEMSTSSGKSQVR